MSISRRKTSFGLPLIVVILLSIALLPGCETDTDEDKVRDTLAVVEKSVEEKDIRTALSRISKTYRDGQGNDFEGIKGLILFYFFRHAAISVLLHEVEIQVQGAAATADFQALLSSRAGESVNLLPEAVGSYRFHVVLTRESDEWKVQAATWEKSGGSRGETAE
ncbi:MAG: hypothetical protein A2010_16760 [Nitrospirae bacterium GWD2_57_9]|nr:MAG: hypothetical protein A2010_16760 [Nitrospirae bacterium GWD2_57_9]OGW51149.1 MAG: hypothetical protein A2078_13510 [Nitrospirae bacterium GWC2_57_9]